MRPFSAATGTTALTLVRAARTGTTQRRTRTTTSGRASPVPTQHSRFALAKAVRAVQHVWSAELSSFGEYTNGSGITQSSEISKREACR